MVELISHLPSPEPLPINPSMIGIDLDKTLVKYGSAQERPGATRLLKSLNQRGLQVILMSTAPNERSNSLFAALSLWQSLISNCIWLENLESGKNLQQQWLASIQAKVDEAHGILDKEPSLLGTNNPLEPWLNIITLVGGGRFG